MWQIILYVFTKSPDFYINFRIKSNRKERGLEQEIGNSHCWSRYQETSSNRLRTQDCVL
jgi:hypothetical protein